MQEATAASYDDADISWLSVLLVRDRSSLKWAMKQHVVKDIVLAYG